MTPYFEAENVVLYNSFRECVVCGHRFGVGKYHGKQKRCDRCRYITCIQCGNQFIPKTGNYGQKFCSRKCKNQSQIGQEPTGFAMNRGRKPRTYHLKHRDRYGSVFDKEWRTAVFQRDNYTCQWCGQVGGRLQAHHIKPFMEYPNLRLELSNGITLCLECHKETDTFGWTKYHKYMTSRSRE